MPELIITPPEHPRQVHFEGGDVSDNGSYDDAESISMYVNTGPMARHLQRKGKEVFNMKMKPVKAVIPTFTEICGCRKTLASWEAAQPKGMIKV